LNIAANKEWKGGGSGQKEIDKLNDRVTFLIEQVKLIDKDLNPTNLKEVFDLYSLPKVQQLVDFCFRLFS
jgi:hypothetical protein